MRQYLTIILVFSMTLIHFSTPLADPTCPGQSYSRQLFLICRDVEGKSVTVCNINSCSCEGCCVQNITLPPHAVCNRCFVTAIGACTTTPTPPPQPKVIASGWVGSCHPTPQYGGQCPCDWNNAAVGTVIITCTC